MSHITEYSISSYCGIILGSLRCCFSLFLTRPPRHRHKRIRLPSHLGTWLTLPFNSACQNVNEDPPKSPQGLNKVFISCRSKFNYLFTWHVSTFPATLPQFLFQSGDRACLVVFCLIFFRCRQLCRQPFVCVLDCCFSSLAPLINHPVRLFIMRQPSRHLGRHWLLSPWHSVWWQEEA